ncbi:MAG TPA: DUF4239 domain-containing protein [bacterium]|nr:DUF4239 domain-containing protein [bacterium]
MEKLQFYSELIPWIVLGLLLGMLVCVELGYVYGIRKRRRASGLEDGSSTGTIETSILALLGLLLAFTFSAAQSRMDQRRQLIIQEANAIGTAYLRLDILPEAAQPELRLAFKEYLDTRIAVYRAVPDMPKVSRELKKAQGLQQRIWSEAVRAVKGGEPGAAVVVLPALNEMIDITTTRTTMALIHTPLAIFALLWTLALLGAAVAGYGMSKSPNRSWFHRLAFVAIISATIFVIMDLEFPRRGLIRLDSMDQLLVELRESMGP